MTNKESADSPQVSWFVFEAPIIVNAAQFNLFEVDNSVYAGYINGQQEIAQQQRNGIVRKYVLDNINSNLIHCDLDIRCAAIIGYSSIIYLYLDVFKYWIPL